MDQTLTSHFMFLIFTVALLALVFGILVAVGYRKNKAFRECSAEEKAKIFSRPPRAHDIVLLHDGQRVTLLETPDHGKSWQAETINDYAGTPAPVAVLGTDIIKIEYFYS